MSTAKVPTRPRPDDGCLERRGHPRVRHRRRDGVRRALELTHHRGQLARAGGVIRRPAVRMVGMEWLSFSTSPTGDSS
jgi:hypothetical protein